MPWHSRPPQVDCCESSVLGSDASGFKAEAKFALMLQGLQRETHLRARDKQGVPLSQEVPQAGRDATPAPVSVSFLIVQRLALRLCAASHGELN